MMKLLRKLNRKALAIVGAVVTAGGVAIAAITSGFSKDTTATKNPGGVISTRPSEEKPDVETPDVKTPDEEKPVVDNEKPDTDKPEAEKPKADKDKTPEKGKDKNDDKKEDEKPTIHHTVTYLDADGKAEHHVAVEDGAKAPAYALKNIPEGKVFKSWDNALDKVTQDTIVNPVLEVKKVTIKFEDHERNTIEELTVDYGTFVASPEHLNLEGYDFKGWSADTSAVKRDMVVTPVYEIKRFDVTIEDAGGVIVKNVAYGTKLNELVGAETKGKTFVKWNVDDVNETGSALEKVKGELNLTAVYETNRTEVTFKGFDDAVISTETYDYGAAITVPTAEQLAVASHNFVKWDKEVVTKANADTLKETIVYTAIYEIKTFEVALSVEADGYNGTTVVIKDVPYGTLVTDLEMPKVEGLHFSTIQEGPNVITEDTELTVRYEISKLNVTVLDADGSTIGTDIINYGTLFGDTELKNILATNTPEKEGHNFVGWDFEPFEVAKPETTNDALTIKPVYEIKKFTITYLGQDDQEIGKEIVEWNKDAIVAQTAPEVEGYHFVNWKDANETVAVFSAIKEDLIVKAEYGINVYDVVYKDADGEVILTAQAEHGTSVTPPSVEDANIPYGYHFVEWTANTDVVKDDMIIEPVYAINVYDVVFRGEDGSIIDTLKVEHGSDLVPLEEKDVPTKTGYDFKEWQVDGNAVGNEYFKNVVGDLEVRIAYGIQVKRVVFLDVDGEVIDTVGVEYGNDVPVDRIPQAPKVIGYDFVEWNGVLNGITDHVEINPIYTEKYYDVTLVADGEVLEVIQVQEGKDLDVENAPAKYGYHFVGWDHDGTAIMSDVTVTAEYEINKYNVVFEDDNGNVVETQIVEHGSDAETPEIPEKYGYHFIKWSTDFTGVEGDLVVKAEFEINKYDVIIDNNGTTETVVVEHGQGVDLPTPETVHGYHFVKWSHSGLSIESDMTIEAIYEINKYDVVFNDDNGNEIETVVVEHGSDAVAPVAPEKYGYHFVKWSTEFTGVEGDMVVEAEYAINVYDVTFDIMGEETTLALEHGTIIEYPSNPVVEGYDFVRWDKTYDTATEDTIITAVMKIKTFTVTYLRFDGAIAHQEVVNWKDTVKNAPTEAQMNRVGYEFGGWDHDVDAVTENLVLKPSYSLKHYEYALNMQLWSHDERVKYDDREQSDTEIFRMMLPHGAKITFTKENGVFTGELLITPSLEFGGMDESITIALPTDEMYELSPTSGFDSLSRTLTGETTDDVNFKVKSFNVKFKAESGSLVATKVVEYGDDADTTGLSVLNKTGYDIVGWSSDITNVKSDLEVTPIYEIQKFNVVFKDMNGEVVDTQVIEYGSDATLPDAPLVEGYDFTSWSVSHNNIRRDTEITARYKIKTYTVKFYNKTVSGESYLVGTKTVDHGQAVEAPTDVTAPKTYVINGWNQNLSEVKGDLNATVILGDDPLASIVTIDVGDGNTATVRGYFDRAKSVEAFNLTNDLRETLGIEKLAWSEELYEQAKIRAVEASYLFDHLRPNGSSFQTFPVVIATAENIARGSSTAQGTLNQWINSSGHYATMVATQYRESLAVAYFDSATTGVNWVQLFSQLTPTQITDKH